MWTSTQHTQESPICANATHKYIDIPTEEHFMCWTGESYKNFSIYLSVLYGGGAHTIPSTPPKNNKKILVYDFLLLFFLLSIFPEFYKQ